MRKRRGMSQGSALGAGFFQLRRSARLRQKREDPNPDRLSNLPDHITHRILSFLPTKDAVRASVLSKRWQSLWWSYHIHDFDEDRFMHLEEAACRLEFINSLVDPLHRGHVGPPTVQKLRVRSVYETDVFLQAYIDAYIGLGTTQSKLLELDLTLDSSYCLEHSNTFPNLYVVPDVVFKSCKSLTSLILQTCDCGPFENVSLPSLKKLFMRNSCIDEDSLFRMISNSPILEELKLEFCFGFNVVRVSNPSLKYFALASSDDLTLIKVNVPNLSYFKFRGSYSKFHYPELDIAEQCAEIIEFAATNAAEGLSSLKKVFLSNLTMENPALVAMFAFFKNIETIKLHYCSFDTIPLVSFHRLANVEVKACEYKELFLGNSNLSTLDIDALALPSKDVFDNVSESTFIFLHSISLSGVIKFPGGSFDFNSGPCLKVLTLSNCVEMNEIRLSSASLTTLLIDSCTELEEASIITPNLESFKFVGHVIEFSPMVFSEHARIELDLLIPNELEESDVYEHKLWFFFRSFESAKFISISCENPQYIITPTRSRFRPPICCPEELKVKSGPGELTFKTYLIQMMNHALCFKTLHLDIYTQGLELNFFTPSDMSHFENRKNNKCTNSHDCLSHLYEAKFKNFECTPAELEVLNYLLREATNMAIVEFCVNGFRGPVSYVLHVRKNNRHELNLKFLGD